MLGAQSGEIVRACVDGSDYGPRVDSPVQGLADSVNALVSRAGDPPKVPSPIVLRVPVDVIDVKLRPAVAVKGKRDEAMYVHASPDARARLNQDLVIASAPVRSQDLPPPPQDGALVRSLA